MNTLRSILKEKKVDTAFSALGLDFDAYFPEAIAAQEMNPYQDYEWIVKIVPEFGHVINAVPIDTKLNSLFWEEWFSKEGRIYHHLLFLQEPEHYDEIFNAPAYDDIHPVQTLGKTWYVIDEQDLHPMYLREMLREY